MKKFSEEELETRRKEILEKAIELTCNPDFNSIELINAEDFKDINNSLRGVCVLPTKINQAKMYNGYTKDFFIRAKISKILNKYVNNNSYKIYMFWLNMATAATCNLCIKTLADSSKMNINSVEIVWNYYRDTFKDIYNTEEQRDLIDKLNGANIKQLIFKQLQLLMIKSISNSDIRKECRSIYLNMHDDYQKIIKSKYDFTININKSFYRSIENIGLIPENPSVADVNKFYFNALKFIKDNVLKISNREKYDDIKFAIPLQQRVDNILDNIDSLMDEFSNNPDKIFKDGMIDTSSILTKFRDGFISKRRVSNYIINKYNNIIDIMHMANRNISIIANLQLLSSNEIYNSIISSNLTYTKICVINSTPLDYIFDKIYDYEFAKLDRSKFSKEKDKRVNHHLYINNIKNNLSVFNRLLEDTNTIINTSLSIVNSTKHGGDIYKSENNKQVLLDALKKASNLIDEAIYNIKEGK